jgi:uncharacterized Zn-binding protein involved in type VI secretion
MLGRFGAALWGLSEFLKKILPPPGGGKLVAVVGDTSTHGGSIITSGQDGSITVGGFEVAVDGAILDCPSHGNVVISSVISKTYGNSKLLVTMDATASCGAKIIAVDRRVYAG